MKRWAWRRTSASVSADDRVERVAGEHRVEAVAPGRLRDRSRGQLDEIERVARERLDRAMKRTGTVVGLEREGDPPVAAFAELGPVRDRDEARVRLRVVADVGRQHDEPVQRSGQFARDRRLGRLAHRAPPALPRRRSSRPRSPTPRAATPAGGRHWSSATGCERTIRISSSGTSATPTRKCRIGRITCALIEVAESTSRSWVSATGPEIELSIGRTPASTRPEPTAATTSENDGSASRLVSGRAARTQRRCVRPRGPDRRPSSRRATPSAARLRARPSARRPPRRARRRRLRSSPRAGGSGGPAATRAADVGRRACRPTRGRGARAAAPSRARPRAPAGTRPRPTSRLRPPAASSRRRPRSSR